MIRRNLRKFKILTNESSLKEKAIWCFNMWICENCGLEHENDSAVCKKCGELRGKMEQIEDQQIDFNEMPEY
jgi:rubrerythrin